jgi:flagellar basal-body rod protein FlgB
MNYGIYLNTAGALAEEMRQDVLANNIANINTTGFNSDRAVFRSRLNEAMARGDMNLSTSDPSTRQIGGGIYVNEVSHGSKIGGLQSSERPFSTRCRHRGSDHV